MRCACDRVGGFQEAVLQSEIENVTDVVSHSLKLDDVHSCLLS